MHHVVQKDMAVEASEGEAAVNFGTLLAGYYCMASFSD